MERVKKFIRKNINIIGIIVWIVYVLVIAFFLFLPFAASAAELEDYRHKLCAEGKLAWLDVGSIGYPVNNPAEEVHRTDRPFYAEVKKGGKIIGGCIPAGTPISAKKGNRFAEHFALKGWRDILNFIPLPVALPIAPVVEIREKEVVRIVERPASGLPSREDIEEVIYPSKKKLMGEEPVKVKSGFLRPSGNFWRGLSYCVGGGAAGYGIKSEKNEFIGGGAVVIGVTLYYDSDKSFLDQLSWADAGTGVICGVASYLVSPEKKEDPPPPSSPPPSASPGPGPNPPQGNGNNNGGDGSSPGPDPVQ